MNPNNSPQVPTKKYTEDIDSFKSMFMDELRNQKQLIEEGADESASGSDDAPSEDNMTAEELVQVIPAVDKKLKNALKKLKNKENAKQEKALKTKPAPPKQKNSDISDAEKAKRNQKKEEELKKNEKKKPIMVDAYTQTEKSDYALIKYKMQKRAQKQQLKMLSNEKHSTNTSAIMSDSGYKMGGESQFSNSLKGVTTPHNNRAASYINNSYKNNPTLNNRTMREEKSFNQVKDNLGALKSHSNARGYKNTFYDSINSGIVYNENDSRGGSISMNQRRKSKRGAEVLKQAYHTEEMKQSPAAFYSANKADSRLNRSKVKQNHPQISDIRKSLTRKKISDTNSFKYEHSHTGKLTGKNLESYIKTTDSRVYDRVSNGLRGHYGSNSIKVNFRYKLFDLE